jgi:hypothetical protein
MSSGGGRGGEGGAGFVGTFYHNVVIKNGKKLDGLFIMRDMKDKYEWHGTIGCQR